MGMPQVSWAAIISATAFVISGGWCGLLRARLQVGKGLVDDEQVLQVCLLGYAA